MWMEYKDIHGPRACLDYWVWEHEPYIVLKFEPCWRNALLAMEHIWDILLIVGSGNIIKKHPHQYAWLTHASHFHRINGNLNSSSTTNGPARKCPAVMMAGCMPRKILFNEVKSWNHFKEKHDGCCVWALLVGKKNILLTLYTKSFVDTICFIVLSP